MNETQVKFGVLLPTREAVISGRSDPSVLYQLAERAEVLGFHSVWVGDSLTARPELMRSRLWPPSAPGHVACAWVRRFF